MRYFLLVFLLVASPLLAVEARLDVVLKEFLSNNLVLLKAEYTEDAVLLEVIYIPVDLKTIQDSAALDVVLKDAIEKAAARHNQIKPTPTPSLDVRFLDGQGVKKTDDGTPVPDDK